MTPDAALPLHIATRGLHESTAQQTLTSWSGLTGWLAGASKSLEPAKDRIPLFSPATFEGGISKRNVRQVTAALIDYDGTTPEQFAQVVAAARRYRGFAYTTHSHYLKGEPPCCFRIALALSEPCPAEQWDQLWHQITQEIGTFTKKAPDRSTRDCGRFFYMPAQNPNGPQCWFESWDGPLFDVRGAMMRAQAAPLIIDQLDGSEIISGLDLHGLAAKLERKSASELQTIGRQIKNALRGVEFVQEGNRDNQCWKIAGEIAKAFPRASAPHVAECFRMALELQGEPSVEVFVNQLERQQQNALRYEQEKRALKKDLVQALIPAGEVAPMGGMPTVNDVPLIVQFKNQFWLRDIYSRDYETSYAKADVETGILLKYEQYSKQNIVPLMGENNEMYSLRKLLALYAEPAKKVRAHYLQPANHYDKETQTLNLAPARLADIKPLYNEQIDHWLRALAGESYPDLEAWLKAILRLDMPCPSLYLWGTRGVGKTLIAFGLAKLWRNPLVRFDDVIGNFNSSLTKCPLVLADEGFPAGTSFGFLRSFLSTGERSINEKYSAPYTLEGHVRMIVTANNPAAFEMGKKALDWEDTQAISERVMQIKVRHDAKAYLESLGSVRNWVDDGLIARHVLWLCSQLQEAPTGRWAVVAKHSDPLSFGARLTEQKFDWFIHWIARYLENPRTIEMRYGLNADPWYLRTHNGSVLIHPMAMQYLDKFEQPSPFDMQQAIRYFAKPGIKQMRVRGNRERKINYQVIDSNRLFEAVKDSIDVSTLVDTVAISTETRLGIIADNM